MKIVHLILAHDTSSLAQLDRLVKKLYHIDSVVFIHVDLKSDLNVFLNYFQHSSQIQFIRKRVNIKWAGYSMVEAEINGFIQILNEVPDFDYLNLLSAQDYPIRSIQTFHDYLQRHSGKAFMHCLDIDSEWVEAKMRVSKYHLINYDFPGKYLLENLINKLFKIRVVPNNMIVKGRSQWFTISKKHVVYVVNEVKRNNAFVRFFKLVWAPDELVFQTLLYNSSFRDDIVNDHLRYIDWSNSHSHPKVLVTADFDVIKKSKKYFARKFVISVDEKIMDLIDASNEE